MQALRVSKPWTVYGRRYGALNVQAGTLFCDSAFQREVASGTLSSASLDRYTCVALAGVATGAPPSSKPI